MLMNTFTQADSPDIERSHPDIERSHPDIERSHPDIERSRDVPALHPYNLQQAVERFERSYIANILELTRWNRRKTAQMLGIPTDVLTSKIRDYQLASTHIER